MPLESKVISLRLTVTVPMAERYRWFWGYLVSGFRSDNHCQACLRGTRLRAVNLNVVPNVEIEMTAEPDELVYLCAGDRRGNWADNLHLAGRAHLGAASHRELQPDGKMRVTNLEEIRIESKAAQQLFPDRGPEFLTCRNFQFGVQMFGTGSDVGTS